MYFDTGGGERKIDSSGSDAKLQHGALARQLSETLEGIPGVQGAFKQVIERLAN